MTTFATHFRRSGIDLRVIISGVSVAAVIVTALSLTFLGDVADSLGLMLLLLSAVFIGLPHGAVDHYVLYRLDRGSAKGRSKWILVLAPYLGLAAAYLVLWFIYPIAAFLFFLLLTGFHWGQADLADLLRPGCRTYLRSPFMRFLATSLRGAIPMLVPLLAFPEVYLRIAENLIGLFSPTIVITESALAGGAGILEIALIILVSCYMGCALLCGAVRRNQRGSFFADLIEILILLLFFTLVPPLLAIAVYFLFWHSLRHLDRLREFFYGGQDSLRTGLKDLVRLWHMTIPMTLVALSLMGVLYLVVPVTPTNLWETIGLYLVLISILTLPHAWSVWKLDTFDMSPLLQSPKSAALSKSAGIHRRSTRACGQNSCAPRWEPFCSSARRDE